MNFRARKITIRGKGRSVSEKLDITDGTAESIALWLDVRPGPKTGPLFIRLDRGAASVHAHTRLTGEGLYSKLKHYGNAIGFPLRPHGVRHTSITSAIVHTARAGEPLTSVQEFARHKSFGTTAGYLNKSGAAVKKVMSLLPT